jgi:hypothetical protein
MDQLKSLNYSERIIELDSNDSNAIKNGILITVF